MRTAFFLYLFAVPCSHLCLLYHHCFVIIVSIIVALLLHCSVIIIESVYRNTMLVHYTVNLFLVSLLVENVNS